MKRTAALTAVVVAGVWASASSAVPPPPGPMISVSHARPVAGRTFVGIVITPQTVIQKVNLRGNIRGWVSRFHAAGKPPVIVCWWRIPAGARGTLKTRIFADGTPIGSVYRWRIRH